ncbi:YihY family inner membrane protein [Acidimicrobiaceae bacterium USS-CC1]|uniref:YihY family inner membrane protein n=1 Tax=Acidiferrimicrobium australe TaxID=2664430 RepID=A0ABW9QUS7_9ACTN|nr:YihY family inner membrane protein [Acidiferrimicrobium australe]
MANTEGMVGAIEQAQRRHRTPAVGWATLKKFQQDRATRLAAMLAFWAFFSVFPLFLLLVSVLGYVLPPSTKSEVLHHVAALFPLLDPSTVGHISGSAWTIVVGGVSALWSGLAVMRATEFAFNSVWKIPMDQRPKQVEQIRRALSALGTIGVGLVISTAISGFVTGKDIGVNLGLAGHIAGYLVAGALDIGLFLVAFRMLTDRAVGLRDMLPGALLSGVVFWILQQLSSFIISRHLQHAQSTYGHFATVITILWWFYLQAVVTMLGAELNVVLHERLYPRSLGGRPETEADRRDAGAAFGGAPAQEDDRRRA